MLGPGARRVLPPAFLTFCAGAVLGWVAGARLASRPEPELDPDLLAYHSAAVAALDLDREQAADLRVLLHYYQAERRRLLQMQRFAVEEDLVDLDRRFELNIWDRILRPDQRAAAAKLLQPVVLSAAYEDG